MQTLYNNFFFSFELAKLPNLEIALGYIGTIFGSRAANRIAQIANMYGLKINQDQVLQGIGFYGFCHSSRA